MQGESRYAKKFRSGKQMYGPGCCAHRREYTEIHTGEVKAGGKTYKSIAQVPAEFLPVFTTQKTARPAPR